MANFKKAQMEIFISNSSNTSIEIFSYFVTNIFLDISSSAILKDCKVARFSKRRVLSFTTKGSSLPTVPLKVRPPTKRQHFV